MSQLLEIEKSVSQLSPKDLGQFRDWFDDFYLQHQQVQAKRPTHLHPVLSKIAINYDPTEPLSDDEWTGDK